MLDALGHSVDLIWRWKSLLVFLRGGTDRHQPGDYAGVAQRSGGDGALHE
jgi:hypothetical protein